MTHCHGNQLNNAEIYEENFVHSHFKKKCNLFVQGTHCFMAEKSGHNYFIYQNYDCREKNHWLITKNWASTIP